ncbi:MAG: D-aminoacyl-tRNA deacylase [Myxococcota bacterium]
MMCVLQRVRSARVEVEGEVVGRIDKGWLALVGAEKGDTEEDADWTADRIAGLRAFQDEAGKMNKAVAEVGGAILVVSQFTLLANLSKGRRPSFERSLEPQPASALCDRVAAELEKRGLPVETGRFGAMMDVHLLNDGPVTFVLNSKQR